MLNAAEFQAACFHLKTTLYAELILKYTINCLESTQNLIYFFVFFFLRNVL